MSVEISVLVDCGPPSQKAVPLLFPPLACSAIPGILPMSQHGLLRRCSTGGVPKQLADKELFDTSLSKTVFHNSQCICCRSYACQKIEMEIGNHGDAFATHRHFMQCCNRLYFSPQVWPHECPRIPRRNLLFGYMGIGGPSPSPSRAIAISILKFK